MFQFPTLGAMEFPAIGGVASLAQPPSHWVLVSRCPRLDHALILAAAGRLGSDLPAKSDAALRPARAGAAASAASGSMIHEWARSATLPSNSRSSRPNELVERHSPSWL